MVQWLRICLPRQETQVPSLNWKISHAAGQLRPRATTIEPVLQSPGAATPEPVCCNYWSPCALQPVLCNRRSHHKQQLMHCSYRVAPAVGNQRTPVQQPRPSTAEKESACSGKVPHAAEQLSLHTLERMLCNQRSDPEWEARASQWRVALLSATGESCEQGRPSVVHIFF